MKRVEPPKGYVLDKQAVEQIMAVEASLLRSEGMLSLNSTTDQER